MQAFAVCRYTDYRKDVNFEVVSVMTDKQLAVDRMMELAKESLNDGGMSRSQQLAAIRQSVVDITNETKRLSNELASGPSKATIVNIMNSTGVDAQQAMIRYREDINSKLADMKLDLESLGDQYDTIYNGDDDQDQDRVSVYYLNDSESVSWQLETKFNGQMYVTPENAIAVAVFNDDKDIGYERFCVVNTTIE